MIYVLFREIWVLCGPKCVYRAEGEVPWCVVDESGRRGRDGFAEVHAEFGLIAGVGGFDGIQCP